MELKVILPILKKHLSDGDDVPYFFRDFIAMITDVKEDEWGTNLDPSTKKVKDETIRSYYKRGLPKKFAQNIVYRLNWPYLKERINDMPEDARRALADDLTGYDPSVNADNVADYVMAWVNEGVQSAAGLVPQDKLQKKAELQRSADLKIRFGDYLLAEENNCCGVPGCGKSLIVWNDGVLSQVYEVSKIDKSKDDNVSNLIAMCPTCHAAYSMDTSKKRQREIAAVKNTLNTHMQSIHLIDDLPIEHGIVGVVKRIKKLNEKDFETAKLDPKEIKQKLSMAEDAPIYFVVNAYVTTYFRSIKAIMINLDKAGEIDFEEIQDQMHAIYRRLKKTKKTKIEIFNEIVEKVKRVTLSESVYCQIVVSYFIQSCEVFDAIA